MRARQVLFFSKTSSFSHFYLTRKKEKSLLKKCRCKVESVRRKSVVWVRLCILQRTQRCTHTYLSSVFLKMDSLENKSVRYRGKASVEFYGCHRPISWKMKLRENRIVYIHNRVETWLSMSFFFRRAEGVTRWWYSTLLDFKRTILFLPQSFCATTKKSKIHTHTSLLSTQTETMERLKCEKMDPCSNHIVARNIYMKQLTEPWKKTSNE